MNKNLPMEIWDMIEVERRRAFRRRVEEFEDKFEYSVGWKYQVLMFNGLGWIGASWVPFRLRWLC